MILSARILISQLVSLIAYSRVNSKIAKDSNLVSLLPKATEDSGELKRQVSFADDKEMDEKSKRDEKKSKPKKSRLGPIISPDVIGIERNVETKDGTKKIVEKVPGKPEEKKDLLDDKVAEGNSETKKVDTGANKSIKETLASLKQASGQSGEDISTNQITADKAIDVDVHPVNLTKKTKKKESKSKKEEFKLDEELVKNEDDQKIIAVKVPENIKNFGKSKFSKPSSTDIPVFTSLM